MLLSNLARTATPPAAAEEEEDEERASTITPFKNASRIFAKKSAHDKEPSGETILR
jgi:hypothetical protein